MRLRDIISEKIIGKDSFEYEGKMVRTVDLMNPSKAELMAALKNSMEGDLRGLLTMNGDLFLGDAAFNNHTDVAEKYIDGSYDEALRLILMDSAMVAEMYTDDENIFDPDEIFKRIKNSRLSKLYPDGTKIHAAGWDMDYSESQEKNFIL